MKKEAKERRWVEQERFLEGTVSVKEVLNHIESDFYMDLAGATQYLPLCEKTIRAHLDEIRHFRFAGKIIFKRSEIDLWMETFRPPDQVLDEAVEKVEEMLGGKTKT